jgi:hypothetical protein
MQLPPDRPAARIPRWIVGLGSVLIGFHFLCVGINVLAAPSGPWPEMGRVDPPPFAVVANSLVAPTYLLPLKMGNNYHFPSNIPGTRAVYIEARLKDESGKVFKTVILPDPEANSYVQHRQQLFANGLADDVLVPPPGGEDVAAPGEKLARIDIWDTPKDRPLEIKTVSVLRVPRGRPVFRPSEWSLVLARSYARHVRQTHGAARVEILRHWADPIPPMVLFGMDPRPGAFDEQVANFGEFPR